MELTKKQLVKLLLSKEEADNLFQGKKEMIEGRAFAYAGVVSPSGGDTYSDLMRILPCEQKKMFDQLCKEIYLEGCRFALGTVLLEEKEKYKNLMKEIKGKEKCSKKQGK